MEYSSTISRDQTGADGAQLNNQQGSEWDKRTTLDGLDRKRWITTQQSAGIGMGQKDHAQCVLMTRSKLRQT
eukprot:9889675-Ditylum_brightwellii.AAC.1